MNELEDAEINLTPLIDVVFVILIMFIIVAPLLELDRVSLAEGPPLDAATAVAIESKSPITIHVLGDNSLLYNKQNVSLKELAKHLEVAKLHHPKERPQLFQDKNAQFGTYQSVKNVVAAAGFDELDVILKPE